MPPTDPYRPTYHLTLPNWINDPIPFYDAASGTFHVFLQHNPSASVWGDMHWAHCVSKTGRDWVRLPDALAPSRTPGDPDFGGVWTGCVTRRRDGRYVALYTGIRTLEPFTQTQCAALSDDLITWEKHPGNPLSGLSFKPDGYGDCFRDPQTFVAPNGRTYCVVGGEQLNGAGGAAFLYEATDETLLSWEYRHVLFAGTLESGHDFECPDFFQLSGSNRWCLLTSRGKTWWHTGTLDEATMRFTREAWGAVDTETFYAGKTCLSWSGERLLFGWLREARPEAEQIAAGWSGVLSLPRRVRPIHGKAEPRFTDISDLYSTFRRYDYPRVVVAKNTTLLLLESLPGACHLLISFTKGSAATSRGVLLCGAGGEELRFCAARGRDSSLTCFVDRSVVEVFRSDGRNGTVETRRVYPQPPGQFTLKLFAEGAEVAANVSVWER